MTAAAGAAPAATAPAPEGTPTPPAPTPPEPSTDGADPTADMVAEIAKWKEMARKHEERAKQNSKAATDLEALKQQTMTDTEKAIDIAKKEGRTEALREVGTRLVDAEVRAAAAGRADDVVTALLEGLDRARFLDDKGEPDVKAIKAWVDRVAPVQAPGFPDLGQGTRSSSPAGSDNPLLAGLQKLVGQ